MKQAFILKVRKLLQLEILALSNKSGFQLRANHNRRKENN